MAAGDLTTLANAQAWLVLPTPTSAQTATLTRLISAVSTRIQDFLGYQVASQTYTRSFDGRGERKIVLPDRPVAAVSSVSINGQPITPAVLPGCGFVFDGKSVALVGHTFCRGYQNVTISYTAGYVSPPFDIEQACLEWVSGSFQSQLRDPAVTEIKAGDTTEKYAIGVTELGETVVPMPSSIFGALLPYRRVSM